MKLSANIFRFGLSSAIHHHLPSFPVRQCFPYFFQGHHHIELRCSMHDLIIPGLPFSPHHPQCRRGQSIHGYHPFLFRAVKLMCVYLHLEPLCEQCSLQLPHDLIEISHLITLSPLFLPSPSTHLPVHPQEPVELFRCLPPICIEIIRFDRNVPSPVDLRLVPGPCRHTVIYGYLYSICRGDATLKQLQRLLLTQLSAVLIDLLLVLRPHSVIP
nr:MAG TPA: hypothetical protein [Caudoviricetes sp.]